MRRWMKVTVAVLAVLALGGWFAAPYVKDWWLVRTACDGVLPSGPVRQLAKGGGHFTKAETTSHRELGDYGCSLRFEGHGDYTLVVRMAAYTRRDDQDSEFLFDFPEKGFPRLRALPRGLPGFQDSFGDLHFLLRCPDLGKDAEGRPRRLLVDTVLGDATARTTHAAYETVVPLVNSASDHLGCGAQPLTVPAGDSAPAGPENEPQAVPVTSAAGTACGWVARSGLPQASAWSVEVLMNDAAPAGRCDLTSGDANSGDEKSMLFAAWYGDWSNRLVSQSGGLRSLTASARCDGEAANFAVDVDNENVPAAERREKRRLLQAFAEDQVRRRGCSGLRLNG
ncbi:hypothetical protein [Streptomyces sp. NPDC002671]